MLDMRMKVCRAAYDLKKIYNSWILSWEYAVSAVSILTQAQNLLPLFEYVDD